MCDQGPTLQEHKIQGTSTMAFFFACCECRPYNAEVKPPGAALGYPGHRQVLFSVQKAPPEAPKGLGAPEQSN